MKRYFYACMPEEKQTTTQQGAGTTTTQPANSNPASTNDEEMTPAQIAQAAAHEVKKERPKPGEPAPPLATPTAPAPTDRPSESSEQKLTKINREFKEKETGNRARQLGLAYINIAVKSIYSVICPNLIFVITIVMLTILNELLTLCPVSLEKGLCTGTHQWCRIPL